MADPKKFRTLNDYRENENEDNQEMNSWYTGGEKSGIQVQAPKNPQDIMKSAKRSGAEQVSEGNSKESFSGTGYRLGVLPDAPSQPISKSQPIKKKIYFWKNGFSVDDGELKSYNDPANQAFVNSINTGQIPMELIQQYGKNLIVDLVSKETEDYKPPPLKPFSGQGQTLGSTQATSVSSNQQTSTSFSNSDINIEIDQSKPTTTIQIRLANGNRLVATFNHTHTIKHIRAYINSKTNSSNNYVLMSSFPQKILQNEDQTLAEANLLNASVMQKLT